jgi:hypothetical protein
MPDAQADYEIDWDDEPLPKITPPPPPASFQQPAYTPPAPPALSPDRELAVVQARAAAAEGADVAEGVVTDSGKVELVGRKFRIAEKIGLMPLLKFASASDMTTEDPRALSAVYSMLKDCIYEGRAGCGSCEKCKDGQEMSCKLYDKGDWGDFEQHAIDTKADADELLAVVNQVLEVISGRPTQPPAGSSPGRRATRRASTGNSSGKRGGASRR